MIPEYRMVLQTTKKCRHMNTMYQAGTASIYLMNSYGVVSFYWDYYFKVKNKIIKDYEILLSTMV